MIVGLEPVQDFGEFSRSCSVVTEALGFLFLGSESRMNCDLLEGNIGAINLCYTLLAYV